MQVAFFSGMEMVEYMEKKKVRLTLRIPEKLDSLIRKEAQKRSLSINQVMVKIINDAL